METQNSNLLPVAIVPAAAMWFPWAETDPTKVRLAILVFAHHVVAPAIFLYGHATFRTLLSVGRYPVRRL